MITVATLCAAEISPSQARVFAEPLAAACERFGIDTPMRQAAFVSQCAHESAGFSSLEESLFYRKPERIRTVFWSRIASMALANSFVGKPQELANHVYANRDGNGDTASGDGWRYRGRGLIQLTFRGAYRRCGEAVGRPYEEQPELLLTPSDACMSAGWYWQANRINSRADTGDVESVTRAINPGMAGMTERVARYALALEAFA